MSPAATRPRAIRESGRQVGSGGTSKLTSTSPESAAFSSRIRVSSLRNRPTTWSRTGSGFGDGCDVWRPASSSETLTAVR